MTGPAARAGAADAAGGAAGVGWGSATGKPTAMLLLRHGRTELSAERRFAGRGDVPLTGEGVKEARHVAAGLAGSGVQMIVSSPLQRARKTAEAIAESTRAPLVVDDDLVEADFGVWEGLTFAEAGAKWPDEMAAWMASPDATPPGGESFAAVALRVLTAIDRVIDAHRHEKVVVVSHVTPIKTVLCRALLAPPEAMFRINLDVASVSRVDCYDNGTAVVRSVNDTSHLQHKLRERRPLIRGRKL